MDDYTFVEDDTGSVLQITFRDKWGDTVNISGATVTLYWLHPVTATLVSRTMTLVDAAVGKAKYQFATTELKPPLMVFNAQVVDVSSKILSTVGPLRERIRPKFTA